MTFYAKTLGDLFERYGSLTVQAPLWFFFVILGFELVGIWYSLRNQKAICPALYLALVLAFPVFGTIAVIAANIIILSKLYHGEDKLRLEIGFRRRIVPILAAIFICDIVYIIFDSMGKYIVDHYTDEMPVMINAAFVTAFIIFLREYRIASSTHYYIQFEEPEIRRTLTEKSSTDISGLPVGTIFTDHENLTDTCKLDVIDYYRKDKYTIDSDKSFNYVCRAYLRDWNYKCFSEEEYKSSFKDVISSEYIGRGVEKLTVCNMKKDETTGQTWAEKITLYRFTKGNVKALLTGTALMALSVFYCTPAWIMLHGKVLDFFSGIFAKF